METAWAAGLALSCFATKASASTRVPTCSDGAADPASQLLVSSVSTQQHCEACAAWRAEPRCRERLRSKRLTSHVPIFATACHVASLCCDSKIGQGVCSTHNSIQGVTRALVQVSCFAWLVVLPNGLGNYLQILGPVLMGLWLPLQARGVCYNLSRGLLQFVAWLGQLNLQN